MNDEMEIVHALSFMASAPASSELYPGAYDPLWVATSVLLSIVASYAALDATSRIEQHQRAAGRLVWSLIGAVTMGLGVWAMHFIGMMALELHCKVYYDPWITLLSMIPGILASGVALGVFWHHGPRHLSPLIGSLLLGAGIGTMHYTGMAAIRMEGMVSYNPWLFGLSILVAVVLSYIALKVRAKRAGSGKLQNLWMATIMGGAISGMHYTAMSAAYFVKAEAEPIPPSLLTNDTLAILIATTTTILALAALASAAISRNREINLQLRENESRFRSLIEAIPDAIFLKDGAGRWLVTNEAAKRIFALNQVDWQGKTAAELTEQYPAFAASHQSCLHDDEKVWQSGVLGPTSEIVHRDSVEGRDFEVRKVPIYDELGGRQALVVIGRDITEQRKAEAKLTLSANVFTHASEAIMITDVDGTIVEVNEAFSKITGYSLAEVVGKNPRILSSGRHNREFYSTMWNNLREHGFFYGEIWNKRKNGEIFPQLQTISAVRDRQGKHIHYVALFSDITERKQAEDEIHTLAFYDGLTQLPNRRFLLDRLGLALSVSSRSRHYGVVMMLDMDKFKLLNDMLGHEYGDLLLIEVAKRIKRCLREDDTVARLGGDEFGVLIEAVDDDAEHASLKASMIAEKIRYELAQPYQLKDSEHISSPSIGVTLYRGNEISADTLLTQADIAMYQAKESGRNAVRFFDCGMQLAVENRAALEADLRHALAGRQLHLYYQPQVDSDQRPVGAEALIRWSHPRRSMVSPAQFIPIAEESSLIVDIGDWVLEEACRQLVEWAAQETTRHLSLAVNVSAQQFKKADFVDKVAALLKQYRIDASRLKLELTESVVLDDIADVVSKMYALKALRIQLSMDDFGTGYSSLSYLKQMPIDQLKIDQSFVRDMTSDQNDAVMVRTIVDLAKNFHLNVIAEGVETEEQLALLKQMGCSVYQGYLFAKPLPLPQFIAWLEGKA